MEARPLAALTTHLLSTATREAGALMSARVLVDAGTSLAQRYFIQRSKDPTYGIEGSLQWASELDASVTRTVAKLLTMGASVEAEKCLLRALHGRSDAFTMMAWCVSRL